MYIPLLSGIGHTSLIGIMESVPVYKILGLDSVMKKGAGSIGAMAVSPIIINLVKDGAFTPDEGRAIIHAIKHGKVATAASIWAAALERAKQNEEAHH